MPYAVVCAARISIYLRKNYRAGARQLEFSSPMPVLPLTRDGYSGVLVWMTGRPPSVCGPVMPAMPPPTPAAPRPPEHPYGICSTLRQHGRPQRSHFASQCLCRCLVASILTSHHGHCPACARYRPLAHTRLLALTRYQPLAPPDGLAPALAIIHL